MTTTTTTTITTVQFNKLPLTTDTIRFNNDIIQTHAFGSICVRRDGI